MTEMWEHFKQCYFQLMEKNIPFKHIKQGSRPKHPWVRYNPVQKANKTKRAKQVVVRKSGLSADHITYELEKLQTVLKEAKLHYEEKLVDHVNVNDKRFWNYTRHFTKSSSRISDLNFEGKNFSDGQTKANILNNYFIYVSYR